jgi:hypothetical protein
MYAKDVALRAGQSVTIEVSNKPYVDKSIPPQSKANVVLNSVFNIGFDFLNGFLNVIVY